MKTTLLVTLFVPLLLEAAIYKNTDKLFRFDYPEADWEVVTEKNDPKKQSADVDKHMLEQTLVTIQRKVADDKYRARFSVVLDDLKKAKGKESDPLLRYRNYAVDFLKNQRFTIQSTEPKKLPGVSVPATQVVAYQRDFGLTFHQVIFVKNEEVYLLTAATRTAKYESYAKEIEKLFDSFRFE